MFYDNEGGFRVDFPNGWTVSVQWGAGNYGDNHAAMSRQRPAEGWSSRTAEVASWRTNARDAEAWYDGNPNGVRGYMDTGDVMEYMRMISDLEDTHQPAADSIMAF
jgi:hypothetical protein